MSRKNFVNSHYAITGLLKGTVQLLYHKNLSQVRPARNAMQIAASCSRGKIPKIFKMYVIGAMTLLFAKGSSDPPNLLQLECSLHKLAYEFGVSKVSNVSMHAYFYLFY